MIQQIAAEFRKKYRFEGRGGVVVVYDGEASGWSDELRNPERWQPGCIAVKEDGTLYKSVGGNDYDGAEEWVPHEVV